MVVIDQADALTRDAQAALRRTMEKYTTNMRLILCCNNLNKIIAPVRSRCLLVRVARPNLTEVSGDGEGMKHEIRLFFLIATCFFFLFFV